MPARPSQWLGEFDRTRPIVVACKAGHEMSQMAVAQLRAAGFDARVLDGGYGGWAERRLALRRQTRTRPHRAAAAQPVGDAAAAEARPRRLSLADPPLSRPRTRACCSSIPIKCRNVAREAGAIPFDIKDVELSHEGERCTFDTMLKLFGLESEPSLARLALIVRGADTARPDLAPEAAGLHAVALGLSALAGDDDHGLLQRGFLVYDALFAWLRFAADERHNWPAKAA